MNAYRLTVAYDGTDYWGWQQQPNGPTVACALEKAYKQAFGHDIRLLGASRTDAGVHALGQVARFFSPLSIDTTRLRNAWNGMLPPSIKIRSLERAADDFHPHKDVAYKVYFYHIFMRRPLPFMARYGSFYARRFDPYALSSALRIFQGQHNFWTFRAEGGSSPTDICTVKHLDVEIFKRFNMLRISVCGDRFLYHMVRRMVGAAMSVVLPPYHSTEEIREALAMQTSRNRFPTAPSQGLVLRRIVYKQRGGL